MRRIDKIHIQNFETIEDAWLEFDQRGVIVLKGYNDSGKSAIILALRVFLYDYKRREHSSFVRDDTEYARIVWYDTDGTIILRDIYANGQSYYKVFKDSFDNMIFTTIDNGMIVPFDGVPEFIQDIFGVGSYGKLYLNAGDDRDPILLAETSGGDNYKFLSTQLYSDELALASSLLNSDKNEKQTKLSELNAELRLLRKEHNSLFGVTQALVDRVTEMDNELDTLADKREIIEGISEKDKLLSTLARVPNLNKIDTEQLKVISDIYDKSKVLTKEDLCTLPSIESERLSMLNKIIQSCTLIDKVTLPTMESIDIDRLSILYKVLSNMEKLGTETLKVDLGKIDEVQLRDIEEIVGTYSMLVKLDNELSSEEALKEELKTTLGVLEKEVSQYKIQTVKCNNCGTVITLVE